MSHKLSKILNSDTVTSVKMKRATFKVRRPHFRHGWNPLTIMQLAVNNRNNHLRYSCLCKYDAFGNAIGNAIGNSIVRRAQSGGSAAGGGDKAAKGTQAGQQVYQEAINGGASPPQATVAAARAIAESTGGAVNVTDELAAQLTAKNSFAYNENDTFQLSNGSDTAIINFGRPEDVNYTLSGISQFLSGSPASDLSYNFAVNSIAGKFGRDASFASGVARGEASYINGMNNRVFTGLDVRSDVLAQAAYDNSIWSQGKQNAQDFSDGIDYAVDITNKSFGLYFGDNGVFERIFDASSNALGNFGRSFIPESGGYTFAYGGSAAGDAGLSVAGANGEYLSVDFNQGEISFGDYWSLQGGSTVGIPGVDAGVELTIFDSPDFNGAFKGMFNASGGQIGAGGSFALEKITTMPKIGEDIIHGMQMTIGVTTPTAEIHTQFGYGEYYNNTTLKFEGIPQYLWHRLTK